MQTRPLHVFGFASGAFLTGQRAEQFASALLAPICCSPSYLPEALEVQDEDVGQSPQAHLHHALLKLLTVGTLPRIIWGELEAVKPIFQSLLKQHQISICMNFTALAELCVCVCVHAGWFLLPCNLKNIHIQKYTPPTKFSPKLIKPQADEVWPI